MAAIYSEMHQKMRWMSSYPRGAICRAGAGTSEQLLFLLVRSGVRFQIVFLEAEYF